MSMTSLTLRAPAKINLSLRILGKRHDGYHELHTVFQRITLADQLSFRAIPKGINLRCAHSDLPSDSTNLVFKACRLVQSYSGLKKGVEVFLEKRIPLASGMGGGSSDAATALIGMNRLFRLGLREDELLHLGQQLGADVPFFIFNSPLALGEGRGDILTSLPSATKMSVCLTFLPEGISTKSVYNALVLAQNPPSLTKISCDATMLSVFLTSKNLPGISNLLRNDLLKPACQIKPAIGRVLSFLRREWPCSAMSGSGPTLFTLFEDMNEARSAARKISGSLGLMTWAGRMG